MAKGFPMKWIAIGIVVLVVLGLVGFVIGTYNGIIAKEEGYKSAWSKVENQYQRQADLIPNLVATLKNYQQFEAGTLTEITNLRSQWQTAATIEDKDTVGQGITAAIGRLLLVYENYPNLKTIEAVSSLMDELAGTQNRISTERGRFIESVQSYNVGIRVFPANLIAGMFGFEQVKYFEAAEGAGSNITVNL
jgi:LemA protein